MQTDKEWYLNQSEADDYQYDVMIQPIDKPIIVTGCAGSGKSVLALWKAKQIEDYRKGSCLYIIYTKALRQYMDSGVNILGVNPNTVLYYNEWKSRKSPSADYIIVDEAQDFSRDEIFLFMRKARKAVFFYGDSAQQLYEFDPYRRPVDMEEIISITGYKEFPLFFNHRLPAPVAEVAKYVNDQGGKKNDPLFVSRCTNKDGEKPRIIECSGIYDQYNTILPFIEKIHQQYKKIGILFRHNKQVKKAYEYFRTHSNIDFDVKYSRGRDNKVFEMDFKNDNPKLMTYHSAKGIQFSYVIIIDCKDDDEDDVIPLYVAMTRTSKELIIMHSGNLASFLRRVPYTLYQRDLYSASASTKKKLSF